MRGIGALETLAHVLRTPVPRLRKSPRARSTTRSGGAPRRARRTLEEADRVSATPPRSSNSEPEAGTPGGAGEGPRCCVADEALSLHADEAEDRGIAIAWRSIRP